MYRVVMVIDAGTWVRYKTQVFSRDLTPNERESYKFMRQNAALLGLSTRDIKKYMTTVLERGTFYEPMALFNRLTALLPGFASIGDRIVSAAGKDKLVLQVRSLPATLVVIEVFKDYHWRVTRKPALVQSLSLAGTSQLAIRGAVSPFLSRTLDWQTALAAFF